jgi:hypothetical protein
MTRFEEIKESLAKIDGPHHSKLLGDLAWAAEEIDRLSKLEAENERLRAALSPFAAIGKTIVPNWPGCCRLRIDARLDGSEYHCYHGTPDEHLGLLPTLDEWRKAAEAAALTHERNQVQK